MKNKNTFWGKIKNTTIGFLVLITTLLIIGATQVNPPDNFQEIVTGEVSNDLFDGDGDNDFGNRNGRPIALFGQRGGRDRR